MKRALYFGSLGDGHFLNTDDGYISRHKPVPGLPWDLGLMDTGLLKNGGVPDHPDGRVFWTCGGVDSLWIALYWWDRSEDTRPGSNSGFYVETELKRAMGITRAIVDDLLEPAFAFACAQWPKVVARQRFPLVLQRTWREDRKDAAT